jgi:hypothetical protein
MTDWIITYAVSVFAFYCLIRAFYLVLTAQITD